MENNSMNIFESLENLPVSEACFEDILNLIEEEISNATIEGSRRRKLGRLNKTLKSLENQDKKQDEKIEQARTNLEQAETNKQDKSAIYAPVADAVRAAHKPSERLRNTLATTYANWRDARNDYETARDKLSDEMGKGNQIKRDWLKTNAIKKQISK